MPRVALPYAYVDGNTFDPAEHNKNLFDTGTGTGTENGVMSTSNGGLEYDSTGTTKNLQSDFILYAEHVQPGCGIVGDSRYNLKPADYVDDAFTDDTGQNFVALAGPTIRFTASRSGPVLFGISFYLSWHKPIVDDAGTKTEPDIIIRPKLNGSAVTELSRNLPASVGYDLVTTADAMPAHSREIRLARHYNLTWLATLTEGMNELRLEMYVQKVSKLVPFARSFGTGASAVTTNGTHYIGTRVSFGVRGISMVEL